jgi:GT2 family glycosyltransferase/glycosyltransferase involved in cell wall biosynthesis
MPETPAILALAGTPRNHPGPSELRKCLAAKEQTVRALQAQLTARKHLEEGLRDQLRPLAPTHALIVAMKAHLTAVEAHLAAREAQFTAMSDSTAWKLVQVLRRAKLTVAPPGSGRDHAWLLARRAWRVWRTEGFLRLLRRAGGKVVRKVLQGMTKAAQPLKAGVRFFRNEGLKALLQKVTAKVGLVRAREAGGPPGLTPQRPAPVAVVAAAGPEIPHAASVAVPASATNRAPWWNKPETVIDLAVLREILSCPPQAPSGSALVDVVVPVYGGLNHVLCCLRSILAAPTATPYELVVINDASPDLALLSCLRLIAERGLITLVHNTSNLGFVRTANLGLSRRPDRDVVLLNSDTEVYHDWLDRLRRAAYSADHVGTVTPFSNNATICSYPRFIEENDVLPDADPASLDAICARVNDGDLVDIPTGVGFCFYVRRDCLWQVGLLDADLFGRGYGEENDFCMRAQEAGCRNVLAADTFVYHRGGVSFGNEKVPAVERACGILHQKYPLYPSLIAGHVAANPALPFRRRIDLARLTGPKRVLLHVLHDLGGGTERHVLDMAARLEQEGTRALILRPAGDLKVRLDCPAVADTPSLIFDVREEYWTLSEALLDLGVQHVHFHHLINVPMQVLSLIADLKLSYDCTVHDYYPICPRINLINGSGDYCGEPSPHGCRLCLERNGSRHGKKVDISQWRETHGAWLAGARKVFVPHADVARRLVRYFPDINFIERRHFEHLERARPVRAPFVSGGPLRVALIGLLAPHKGLDVVVACARDALTRNLPIRFHIVGSPNDPEILSLPNVACTGAYKEEAVFDLLEMERCHCAFFPSVWPETYCYTLSIAFLGQLTPIAFDLGAQAARIRDAGFGHLLPLTTDPRIINDGLLRLADEFADPPAGREPVFGHYPNLLADYYGFSATSVAEAA